MEYPIGIFLNKPDIMHVPRQLQGLGLGRKEGGSEHSYDLFLNVFTGIIKMIPTEMPGKGSSWFCP